MTRESNYALREDRWAIYHSIEREAKQRLLPKLSKKDGFTLFTELSNIAAATGARSKFNGIDMIKIRSLGKIHRIFGRTGQ